MANAKSIVTHISLFGIVMVKTIFSFSRGTCRFYPSCTLYAKEALNTLPIYKSIFYIIFRVLRCNPFFKGGYDPVPDFKKHVRRNAGE